ncbi:MAG: YcfA family protein [Acidobacteria bacterium]|jgi:predicted RNA binding protein YcfA (HicA-like mRNA interferase family)|nr:YcfA family protein [Acidobacteriota bacterium]
MSMAKAPVLKPKEVVAILGNIGFIEVRQRGSHKQFRHADGRCTTVPFHPGRDISPLLLRQIAKDTGLSLEEFLQHR